jgi:hypothetical protein
MTASSNDEGLVLLVVTQNSQPAAENYNHFADEYDNGYNNNKTEQYPLIVYSRSIQLYRRVRFVVEYR